MTLGAWYTINKGQSLSYNGKAEDVGQCVQAVALYVRDVLQLPVMRRNAADWWYLFNLPGSFDRIANTANATPQVGDIIVWDKTLPGSGGYGHVAICWEPRPGTGTFVSADSNWGGKTLKLVTHNYSYVIGWLRPKLAPQQPQQETPEMITTADQAAKLYNMLRPNSSGSQDEINATAGRRSYAQFVLDAQGEVQARDNNLRAQTERLAVLQDTINQLNQTITESRVNDARTFNEYQAKIADLTGQLTTAHDQLADLQDKLREVPEQTVPPAQTDATTVVETNTSLLGKLFAIFFKTKS